MSEDADAKSLHTRLVSWQPAERNVA
jgi:hypothetical protein